MLKIVIEWPSDQVTKWPSDRVNEWPSDWVMSDRVTKWPSDQMTKWLNDQMTKWLGDRMTGSFADDWPYGIFKIFICCCFNKTILMTSWPWRPQFQIHDSLSFDCFCTAPISDVLPADWGHGVRPPGLQQAAGQPPVLGVGVELEDLVTGAAVVVATWISR